MPHSRDTAVRSTLVIGTQQRYCDWSKLSEIIHFSNRQELVEIKGEEENKKNIVPYKKIPSATVPWVLCLVLVT